MGLCKVMKNGKHYALIGCWDYSIFYRFVRTPRTVRRVTVKCSWRVRPNKYSCRRYKSIANYTFRSHCIKATAPTSVIFDLLVLSAEEIAGTHSIFRVKVYQHLKDFYITSGSTAIYIFCVPRVHFSVPFWIAYGKAARKFCSKG